jgi:hypothetical protein
MILSKQRSEALTDREVAASLSTLHGKDVLQQTYNKWKKGHAPSAMFWPALARWLEVDESEVEQLAEETKEAAGSTKLPSFTALAYVKAHGKIADRKEGKYRFEAHNMGRRRVPDGRYVMQIDTKVMEPVFHVGTQIWVDPAIAPQVGNEVVVHADGYGWLGVLAASGGEVVLDRPGAGPITVKNVEAIHVVVLSSRV